MPEIKALLVAGSEESEDVFAEAMTTEGITLRTVRSGARAITAALQLKPDIVVVEGDLPGAEGWKLFHVMRMLPALKETPFLFLCSRKDASPSVLSLVTEVDGFQESPLTPEQAAARIVEITARVKTKVPALSGSTAGAVTCNFREIFIDTVEYLVSTGKTGLLSIRSGSKAGRLYVECGRVKHAELGGLAGDGALKRLIGLEEVEVSFSDGEEKDLEKNVGTAWKAFVASHCRD